MSSSAHSETPKAPEKRDFENLAADTNTLQNSSVSTSPDPTDAYQITDYQTSIFIGKHYSAKDITVNLDVCDGREESEGNYKLTIHCFKRDGNNSSLKKETNPSCLKKESKRELVLPLHANVKTLESFLDDGYLHFTCQVNSKNAKGLTSSSFTNITTTEPSSE